MVLILPLLSINLKIVTKIVPKFGFRFGRGPSEFEPKTLPYKIPTTSKFTELIFPLIVL